MIVIKIILVGLLAAICYQDVKDRLVYWFLFPLLAIALAVLHYNTVSIYEFFTNIIINSILVGILLLVLSVYIKAVRGVTKLSQVLGLGDVCMLLALGLGCATIAFIVLLVFGLLFSLLLHIVLQKNRLGHLKQPEHSTVPLAGYLAVFFSAVFMMQWIGFYNTLYII